MDPLTGERLDDASALYRADLARHRAAYRFAEIRFMQASDVPSERRGSGGALDLGCVLDLGCGTGYGTAELAARGLRVLGFDRVRPAPRSRVAGARFVVGDLTRLPFADHSIERVVSFQVIEHFADPSAVLAELARVLAPDGVALVSTPNRLQSDGENPHHPREYTARELADSLSAHFGSVEMLGVHAVGPAAQYHADRLRQIRRIVRLDPLGLRRKLPQRLVDWAFARLSIVVRRLIGRSGAIVEIGEGDFPIGEADASCLDLLAVCGHPRLGSDSG